MNFVSRSALRELVLVREKPQQPTAFAKAPPRVLVVDDDEAVVRMLRRILRKLGCVVACAGRVAEAREAVASGPASSLVIVDLALADGSGLQLIDELSQFLADESPAFVIFSGATPPESVPPGVAAVLQKPVGVIQIMDAVKEAVLRSRAKRAPRRAAPGLSPSTSGVRSKVAEEGQVSAQSESDPVTKRPVGSRRVTAGVVEEIVRVSDCDRGGRTHEPRVRERCGQSPASAATSSAQQSMAGSSAPQQARMAVGNTAALPSSMVMDP